MTVRIFFGGSLLTALITWTIWLLILWFVDPQQAGLLGFIIFFLSLFLSIASSVALLGFAVRRVVRDPQLPAYQVRNSLRQGVLLALFTSILLLLQLLRLLQWWVALILIILFVSAEFIFLSYDRAQRRSGITQK